MCISTYSSLTNALGQSTLAPRLTPCFNTTFHPIGNHYNPLTAVSSSSAAALSASAFPCSSPRANIGDKIQQLASMGLDGWHSVVKLALRKRLLHTIEGGLVDLTAVSCRESLEASLFEFQCTLVNGVAGIVEDSQ